MTSAELVNLILKTFQNRVTFVAIRPSQYNRSEISVEFTWGHKDYLASCTKQDRNVVVYVRHNAIDSDNYQIHVERRLNGLVRNEEGELVQCLN